MTAISDNDDLWPVLVNFQSAHPLDTTFQVRRTAEDGGGIEIWDPQHRVSLASADVKWAISDHVAKRGVAECATSWTGGLFGSCEGRQLVEFSPALPQEALPL